MSKRPRDTGALRRSFLPIDTAQIVVPGLTRPIHLMAGDSLEITAERPTVVLSAPGCEPEVEWVPPVGSSCRGCGAPVTYALRCEYCGGARA